jgi:hypothetical protein
MAGNVRPDFRRELLLDFGVAPVDDVEAFEHAPDAAVNKRRRRPDQVRRLLVVDVFVVILDPKL